MSPAKRGAKKGAKKVAPPPHAEAVSPAAPPHSEAVSPAAPRRKPATVRAGAAARAVPSDESRAAAKAERRGRAARRTAHVLERMGTADIAALSAAMRAAIAREETPAPSSRVVARAAAKDNVRRWVPLGPSVVRRGQADGRPRVTGRVRDLAVDKGGLRAYAATGKGGVWYTDDGGMSWRPVGGWVTNLADDGGISTDLSCGCILVRFGTLAKDDYVMVGTGEVFPGSVADQSTPVHLDFGGRGVLSGLGPTLKPDTESPFEPDTGVSVLEGAAISSLARDPGVGPAGVGVTGDRVVASASRGLFLGVCTTTGGKAKFAWTRVAGLDPVRTKVTKKAGHPDVLTKKGVTDVQWVPVAGNANGRIVVAVDEMGVAWSDQLGAAGSWNWISKLNQPTDKVKVSGRVALSPVVDGKMYVLLGTLLKNKINGRKDAAQLRRIPDITRALAAGGPGASVLVSGAPAALWGTQLHWDQALFAERVGGADRIWLGGSGIRPYAGSDFSAAIYCFDVAETGTGAPRLTAIPTISGKGAPPAFAGADVAGLVGNGVHADVHAIRVITRPTDNARHVWVCCDGGVYVSELGGRVNTFQSRATGLAAIEAGFIATHPTSSHFCVLGAQDNGSQARVGDTVWELIQMGDGGGQMFHPTKTHFIISQYSDGSWFSLPPAGFVGPIDRQKGGANNDETRESKAAMFYSGCDAIATSPVSGRIALGTNRVWISDDLGAAKKNTWKVVPFNVKKAVAATDPRAAGDSVKTQKVGVPVKPDLGAVAQVRWASQRQLYAMYHSGIVRHDDDGTGKWTTTVILVPGATNTPDLTTVRITDLAPITGTNDFYVTTLGDTVRPPGVATDTCWRFSGGAFQRTNLRRSLNPTAAANVFLPLDPAHAVCVDPDDNTIVYAGTMAGVWRGVRAADGTHDWKPLMNGLPVTCVSDLRIWKDPNPPGGGTALKLLRAATQSRGAWEVKLTGDEDSGTYLRVHQHDDRRRLPTPLLNPAREPGTTVRAHASPDIVVRPAPRLAAATPIPFPLAPKKELGPSSNGSYDLWTFQTAFRWLFPAIRADGMWTDQFEDLLALYRSGIPALKKGKTISADTWNAVVNKTLLNAARLVTPSVGVGQAVFEAPWQNPGIAAAVATEIDLMELVKPVDVKDSIWHAYAEKSVVDILLHHRDTRPTDPNDAYVALFMRKASNPATLLALLAQPFAPLHLWTGVPSVPTPAGWTCVKVGANSVHRLPLRLDAFMPRAISVAVDLSTGFAVGDHVLLLAVCGSSKMFPALPANLTAASTVSDLVRAWPRAAMRMIQIVGPRPV